MLEKLKIILNVIRGFVILEIYKLYMSNVDYFKYKKLSTFPHIILPSPYFFNISYGLYRAVKVCYNGKVSMFKDYIEHGLFYSESAALLLIILKSKPIRRVFTFSNRRKRQIENVLIKNGYYNIDVVAVGPMINRIPNFYSEQKLADIKRKLGRTLLVYPMHSWNTVSNEFSHDSFIDEIFRIKKDFDTVLVCLYYMDIRKGKHKYYEEKGFTVVCNGDRCDPHFMSRQRDLIELADMTMSNGIGTHIGYSIVLGRPHYYFKQEMQVLIAKEYSDSEKIEQEYRLIFEKEVVDLFGEYSQQISKEQKEFVNYHWGLF